jgi:hypothetical protein
MIVMIMRQREIIDVRRLVADLRQLARQRLGDGGAGDGGPARLDQFVRDCAGIPQQGAARMHHKIGDHGHVRSLHPALDQGFRIGAVKGSEIEDIELDRRSGRRSALRLRKCGAPQRGAHQGGAGKGGAGKRGQTEHRHSGQSPEQKTRSFAWLAICCRTVHGRSPSTLVFCENGCGTRFIPGRQGTETG